MITPPEYFETIRQNAARRWDQLEQDHELAAPWHQLFKQVQSPRHVLSELLQNADDAGATEASVRIKDQVFVFEHNGEDFTDDHFASLCRFGYSNKRSLHTIGFRGIGFKSTFSLGDCVELFTPTLAVRFHRERFTEPHWHTDPLETSGKTIIRVPISSQRLQKELVKNLEEWRMSPLSLLFFKNIRSLRISRDVLSWRSRGAGPLANSEWIALDGSKEPPYLLVHSTPERFPKDALAEIKQERTLSSQEELDYPPCTVEIVLGVPGRLFVVLPTGVETDLPFACNAPFIQDPARLKIKDPETSPTNGWLLKRVGKLAAAAMQSWLRQTELSLEARVGAYRLLPCTDLSSSQLGGACAGLVQEAFTDTVAGRPLLLADTGKLVRVQQSMIVPNGLLEIWSSEQIAALLDLPERLPLCRHVDATDRKKLVRLVAIEQIDRQVLFRKLQSKRPPKPKTWRHLLSLWAYIAPEGTAYRSSFHLDRLHIVPVQGKDVLYTSTEVVRLGEKKLLQSDEDWAFLADHLTVLNQNWLRFLTEQRRIAGEQNDTATQDLLTAAYAVLKKVGLDSINDVSTVINRVITALFGQERVSLQDGVRIAQIAAKLSVSVGEAFRYVTRDGHDRLAEAGILFDEDGTLEELLPPLIQQTQLLHSDYTAHFRSCSREEWLRWVGSGHARLHTSMPILSRSAQVNNRDELYQLARHRGVKGELDLPYKTDLFILEDWDFAEAYWQHWQVLAAQDERVWGNVVGRILRQPVGVWSGAKTARLLQIATTGKRRSVTNEPLLPAWALRLRELPCLPDTRGFLRQPDDLLLRTPETEPLRDVEPFVDGRLDSEANRPLLVLLGARTAPTGPDRLLERLRALSRAPAPPVSEVEKWYRRLDQLVDTCSTADLQKIQTAFQTEKLVLTQDGSWATTEVVFLSDDQEDVPEIARIRASVRELTFWRKIGVAERATEEIVMRWLAKLPPRKKLSQDDQRRTRALLARYPRQIWAECAHWLNLAGQWVPIGGLRYALTAQPAIAWRHLHLQVQRQTADMQMLTRDLVATHPFARLPLLAQRLQERPYAEPLAAGEAEPKPWLTTFGLELSRVHLSDDNETQQVRELAERLAQTTWHPAVRLEIVPYIEDLPAGTAQETDVAWCDQMLYVRPLSRAKLARLVPEAIGAVFGRDDVKAALGYSFERSPEEVREYLAENFALDPLPEVVVLSDKAQQAEVVAEVLQCAATNGFHNTAAEGTLDTEAPSNNRADSKSDEPPSEQPRGAEPAPTHDSFAQGGPRSRSSVRPSGPHLIERFATAQGFQRSHSDRFVRPDGHWIGRSDSDSFPWEQRTRDGQLVRAYWLKEHCLEREPLQIPCEVWNMLELYPETHALILVSAGGVPTELIGGQLRKMRDEQRLTLHTATYRLVYEHGHRIE